MIQRNEYKELLRTAQAITRPKALYMPVAVETTDNGKVRIMGYAVKNPILHANLQGLKRAFVFIATCGLELAFWKETLPNPLERFFADLICEHALEAAYAHLSGHIRAAYQTSELACMNPGSTPGWPLEDQRLLFSILADAHERAGVRLLDSCFMVPTQSASGLLFESQHDYHNCRFCPLEKCPNRRVDYDPTALTRLLDGR